MSDSPARAFAVYPSLENASVIVTGGASGIGMEIVRAFAGQRSGVGFLDFDVEAGAALATQLQASAVRRRQRLYRRPQRVNVAQIARLEPHLRAVPPGSDRPVYVARMALFLAADDSAMCTANNYMVEAGSI